MKEQKKQGNPHYLTHAELASKAIILNSLKATMQTAEAFRDSKSKELQSVLQDQEAWFSNALSRFNIGGWDSPRLSADFRRWCLKDNAYLVVLQKSSGQRLKASINKEADVSTGSKYTIKKMEITLEAIRDEGNGCDVGSLADTIKEFADFCISEDVVEAYEYYLSVVDKHIKELEAVKADGESIGALRREIEHLEQAIRLGNLSLIEGEKILIHSNYWYSKNSRGSYGKGEWFEAIIHKINSKSIIVKRENSYGEAKVSINYIGNAFKPLNVEGV